MEGAGRAPRDRVEPESSLTFPEKPLSGREREAKNSGFLPFWPVRWEKKIAQWSLYRKKLLSVKNSCLNPSGQIFCRKSTNTHGENTGMAADSRVQVRHEQKKPFFWLER